MDLFLLQAAAEESQARLAEGEVQRVACLGRSRYLLRFATPGKDNLLFSARPDQPRFHLTTRSFRMPEEPPDRFAALLDHELAGAVAAEVRAWPWERVVEVRFRLPRREDAASERRLLLELFGRSANLLLLDERGLILAFARDLKSEFRAPVAGAPHLPAPGRDRYAGIPPGPGALPFIRDRFSGPAEFLRGLSPLLARDLEAIEAARPGAGWPRLEEILEAAGSGRWSPVIYSTRPLADWAEGDAPGRDDLLLSALPLASPPGGSGPLAAATIATPFRSAAEAAQAGLGLLERLRDFLADRDHHVAMIQREIGHLEILMKKLAEERERARDADRHRIHAEALLAGLASARIEGPIARVPDPYDPAAAQLAVPIDPGQSLPENAQALFARYKKRKRGLKTIETRMAAAQARLGEWRELLAPAGGVRSAADLDRLREAMGRLGLVHAPRPKARAAPRRAREEPARVRRHESPDGLVILVGTSGPENDTLTFRVASPWDFWLHAAGHKGAHVVVRNPQRLGALPDATLRAAAEIAAYYSGARADSKVEVHYTQRKHVHKKKGMPSGQVLVRRFRSVQVAPRLPIPAAEDV